VIIRGVLHSASSEQELRCDIVRLAWPFLFLSGVVCVKLNLTLSLQTRLNMSTFFEESTNEQIIEKFLDALWLEKGLSQNTLESYRRDLEAFNHWLSKRNLVDNKSQHLTQ
jgi:hypothetical protein